MNNTTNIRLNLFFLLSIALSMAETIKPAEVETFNSLSEEEKQLIQTIEKADQLNQYLKNKYNSYWFRIKRLLGWKTNLVSQFYIQNQNPEGEVNVDDENTVALYLRNYYEIKLNLSNRYNAASQFVNSEVTNYFNPFNRHTTTVNDKVKRFNNIRLLAKNCKYYNNSDNSPKKLQENIDRLYNNLEVEKHNAVSEQLLALQYTRKKCSEKVQKELAIIQKNISWQFKWPIGVYLGAFAYFLTSNVHLPQPLNNISPIVPLGLLGTYIACAHPHSFVKAIEAEKSTKKIDELSEIKEHISTVVFDISKKMLMLRKYKE